MNELFPIFSSPTIWGILARFAVDLFFLIILIGLIYFRYSKKEKFVFTFFLIGIIVFFLITVMNYVSLSLGFAVGLFAIFGILRFRTSNFGVKDMAYIFTAIGLSVINSIVLRGLPFGGKMVINVIIVISAFVLEEIMRRNSYSSHRIVIDNLKLLRPENQSKLLEEITDKSGRKILKVRISKVDYKNKTAELNIFFKE